MDAAKVALNRAEQLLRDKAGIVRVVDETRAQVSLAESGLRTAQARRDLLGPPVLEAAVQPRLWVRVPVYVGDLGKLNQASEVRVGGLADSVQAAGQRAKPVTAPPSANAGAATVDLFYEVANQDRSLRLGQRVDVHIPLREPVDHVAVLRSALVYDIQGGAWVYEQAGPQRYVRRRVQVNQVVGDWAALAQGVKPGGRVVVTGVAELFGTEFGAGK